MGRPARGSASRKVTCGPSHPNGLYRARLPTRASVCKGMRPSAMILYHFTDFYYLENGTILQEGLKPDCREDEVKMTPAPSGVVWLTTDTNPLSG
jgi:hypothetical protein